MTPTRLVRPKRSTSLLRPAVFVAACSLGLAACNRQPRSAPAGMAPEVATITVATERIVLATELPGRTSPYLIAEIRPQVSGLIQKRLFQEGAEVKAGQPLYQIDPAPFQAALNNAEAALHRSEASLPAVRARATRVKELVADNAVSQQDYDDAAAALRQVEADIEFWRASVETARINLRYTRITSPISGRIGRSNVTDGAIVTAYQPLVLATIQQLDPIYVDVSQSTREQLRWERRLADGRLAREATNQDAVQLLLEDGTKYDQQGALQFRDVSVDATTGSVILRTVFPNPHAALLPGMYVRVQVKEGVNENAILIPQHGVSRDPKGNAYAMIVDTTGKAQARPLTLDRAIGDRWLVASGLAAGEQVIVEGLLRVRPGMPVRAVPFVPGGGGGTPKGKAVPGVAVPPASKST